MTQEQTKEYTRVIAEFMGYEKWKKDYYKIPNSIWFDSLAQSDKHVNMCVENCRFHNEYRWLMPVWVKFRDLFAGEKYSEETLVKRNTHRVKCMLIERSILNKSISEAFTALAEAIIWYNENKE